MDDERVDVEAEVKRADAVGECSDGDEVDSALGDLADRSNFMPPLASMRARPAIWWTAARDLRPRSYRA